MVILINQFQSTCGNAELTPAKFILRGFFIELFKSQKQSLVSRNDPVTFTLI